MSVNGRTKGSSGEREAATLLLGWAAEMGVSIEPERNLEQTRGGGFDLNGVPGLAVEVKRVEALSVNKWWAQAVRQANDAKLLPFLMYRQNRKPWRFKVRTWTALHSSATGKTEWLSIDTEMDSDMAKLWFQAHLRTVTP